MKEFGIKHQSNKTIIKREQLISIKHKKYAWIDKWTTYSNGDSPLTLS